MPLIHRNELHTSYHGGTLVAEYPDVGA